MHYLFRFLVLLALSAACGGAAAKDTADLKIYYDDAKGAYMARGNVEVAVPMKAVADVAAAFAKYREWALVGINGDAENSKKFITLIRDVRHVPGKTPHGAFELVFDVDLPWPAGSKGKKILFDIVEAKHGKSGGLESLAMRLAGDNLLLQTYVLAMNLSGTATGSRVTFECLVKFIGPVDVFFSVERFKKNVGWRLVKVINNLRLYLEAKK